MAIEENAKLMQKNGIFSGNIRNCFIWFDTTPEIAVLEIFFPKNADEDRWKIRELLNEPYIIKKEWIDSGLRLLLKEIPPKELLTTTEPVIKKIAAYFSEKYPLEVFKNYKHYTCGKLSRVILIHINNTVVLKYCEELRADFTKNYFKVIYNESGKCEKAYINTYELGTMEYKNEKIEMHRWENEDEAQSTSYLSRRYTQRILDGVIEETDTKSRMMEIIKSSMDKSVIEPDDLRYFDTALEILKNLS